MRLKTLLVLPLLLASLQAASVADLTFTLNGDGTEYSVSNCLSSASGSLNIPSIYNGLPVTSIDAYAFVNSGLTSITIPNSVTSIGSNAFQSCYSLSSIIIPNSVTSIGSQAFYNCSGLTSITIPNSVTSIGDRAFSYCSGLTGITIPDSVSFIGTDAFLSVSAGFTPSDGSWGPRAGFNDGGYLTNNMYDAIAYRLEQDDNFLEGVSDGISIDSSAVDQAIADEAQARVTANVILQANIDALAVSMQSYVDSAVAQARADGVSAGIQSVTSNPQSYQLYNESSIMEMNVSNPTLSMLNESEQAQVEFTLETSTDLEDWNIEERIQRTIEATGDKFFVRIKSGIPYVTPTVLVFNHPSYGEILTDQSGNVLYGFSIDSAGGDPIYSGSTWPLAPQIADPEPDAGITAALTSGTFSNASGGPWLKINNRPVYTYAGDSEPNQATGQNSGTVWFTIKPDGTLNQ